MKNKDFFCNFKCLQGDWSGNGANRTDFGWFFCYKVILVNAVIESSVQQVLSIA
jgi:hypothetical protein